MGRSLFKSLNNYTIQLHITWSVAVNPKVQREGLAWF